MSFSIWIYRKIKYLQLLISHNNFYIRYITKRVIAMGFPTTGCESYLRNSANEMQNFFKMYHQEVKVISK